MTRTEMRDTISRIYGLENPITIEFFRLEASLPENYWNNRVLELLVQSHMENPIIMEE